MIKIVNHIVREAEIDVSNFNAVTADYSYFKCIK